MEETKDKKEYEIGFLVKNESDAQTIRQFLVEHGAEIISEGLPKEINLAYKIKKETKAWFGFFRFQIEPTTTVFLKKELRTFSFVLRFLILRSVKKAPSPTVSAPKKKKLTKTFPRAKEKSQLEEKAPPSPLSNEEIEKKIEEILQ